MNRRGFLKMLGIGTGVALAAPALLLPEEPRRRIWQVGIDFAYASRPAVISYSAADYANGVLPGKPFTDFESFAENMKREAEVFRERALLGFGDHSDMVDAFGYSARSGALDALLHREELDWAERARRGSTLIVTDVDVKAKTITLTSQKPPRFSLLAVNDGTGPAQTICWRTPKTRAALERSSKSLSVVENSRKGEAT